MKSDDISEVAYQRRLPHRYVKGHTLFITWRMKFTLPAPVIRAFKEQKAELEQSIKDLSDDYQNLQRYQNDKKLFAWFDDILAQEQGFPDTLANPDVANIVRDSLMYWDQNRFFLLAYCIMPNHVHILITPNCGRLEVQTILSKTMYSIKRYTSNQINKLMGQTGAFWSRESYDRVVRNDEEFYRIIEYIRQNPVKAKLVSDWKDWPHTWVKETLDHL